MGKKKQKKQESSPEQDDVDESEEQAKPKTKSKAKKPVSKAPKETPKKQKKSKPKSKSQSASKGNKNGNKKVDNDLDEQQKIDKKKDFLPGQKYQTPDEDDGARAFYYSLYMQNPESQMARRYCLQYGLLQKQDAIKIQKQLAKQASKKK